MEVQREYTLANGVSTPSIGYGTWRTKPEAFAKECVAMALQAGYRHIDCARVYKNEAGVGEALKESRAAREELFITSKVWCADRGYETTLKAFEQTAKDLGVKYLDCYLIHWPANETDGKEYQNINNDTWRAMEELYRQGKVRAIGVSNFNARQLKALMNNADVLPMVNQIEVHPGWVPQETVSFCQNIGILVEAWSPLGSGEVLDNALLKDIAAKHDKNVGQICVRWLLEKGILPLPKSTNEQRALSNLDVFDFSLTQKEHAAIDALPVMGYSGLDSETVHFDH